MLNPDQKVAHKMALPNGGKHGDAQAFEQKMQKHMAKEEASGEVKNESLGTQAINGVNAAGTRITRTIPAGQIGNDKPIQIVLERWYSPDLQMTVMTKHSDPRNGETNFSLKNINRSGPPPYLFEVPSDYTVNAGGRGGGRSGGPGVPAVRIAEPRK